MTSSFRCEPLVTPSRQSSGLTPTRRHQLGRRPQSVVRHRTRAITGRLIQPAANNPMLLASSKLVAICPARALAASPHSEGCPPATVPVSVPVCPGTVDKRHRGNPAPTLGSPMKTGKLLELVESLFGFGSKRSPVQIRPPRLICKSSSNNKLQAARRSNSIGVSRIWDSAPDRSGPERPQVSGITTIDSPDARRSIRERQHRLPFQSPY